MKTGPYDPPAEGDRIATLVVDDSPAFRQALGLHPQERFPGRFPAALLESWFHRADVPSSPIPGAPPCPEEEARQVAR